MYACNSELDHVWRVALRTVRDNGWQDTGHDSNMTFPNPNLNLCSGLVLFFPNV